MIYPALRRAWLFAGGWLLLTEGSVSGWPLAAGVVVLATAASLMLQPPGGARWRLGGLLRFIPFFLAQSLVGGVDVARRALAPRLPLDPGFVDYPLKLPEGAARQFFAAATGLLPGTLTAQLDRDRLVVHVLDRRTALAGTLERLEARTADLYGLPRV